MSQEVHLPLGNPPSSSEVYDGQMGVRSILLLLAVAARPAVGDEIERFAKIHFQAGQEFYQSHKYQEAVAEFNAGYELTKLPAFLLNVAQCHRMLGNDELARDAYRAFVRNSPGSPHAAEAQKLANDLERAIRARAPLGPPPNLEEPLFPVAATPVLAPIKIEDPPPRRRWWILWTAIAVVGSAGLAVGLGLGLQPQSMPPAFQGTLPDFQALTGALPRF
jgi:hypothetical protein